MHWLLNINNLREKNQSITTQLKSLFGDFSAKMYGIFVTNIKITSISQQNNIITFRKDYFCRFI